ncbi:MAG: TRAP transporter small permease subunit [Bacteroidetes bacterium]|jgi:TRAP-type mannitol/chloroaromatic compound transport system permease small subunit|nr:TRAP transporter small permease subunit [Bacteroidota bacterium]MDF1867563.1 TRAP transporter small permease subunit [Saprospiraceae bacterium]
MKDILLVISKRINTINEAVGKLVSWIPTVLVLLVCFDVTVRYVFSDTAAWIMELEWHLFALIFLLGAGYALKHNRHVRVDLFYANFSEHDRALTNLVGTILFLIPWCILIIIFSFNYGLESWNINEGSPDPGGLPARYIIKFSMTLGMVLLLLQAVSIFIDSLLTLRSIKRAKNGI